MRRQERQKRLYCMHCHPYLQQMLLQKIHLINSKDVIIYQLLKITRSVKLFCDPFVTRLMNKQNRQANQGALGFKPFSTGRPLPLMALPLKAEKFKLSDKMLKTTNYQG